MLRRPKRLFAGDFRLARVARRTDLLLTLILGLCIVRLWLMPLSSSLWVDEMGTVFVIHHPGDPSLRAAAQVAQSIYYVLPRLAEALFGPSEMSYRIFSVAATAGALLLIASLAGRLLHPAAKWFAVFACMALHGFNIQADDARPYALGTLALCAALWLEVRWLDTARGSFGSAFVIAAILLWWVHLLLWPFYLVFATYAIRPREAARNTRSHPGSSRGFTGDWSRRDAGPLGCRSFDQPSGRARGYGDALQFHW